MARLAIFLSCLFWTAVPVASDWTKGRWVDLTHAFSTETIYWPTAEAFKLDVVSHGMTEKGYFYAANNFAAAEHGGTHIDAPIHFAHGRQSVDQIPVDRLIGPAVVIDVSTKALSEPDYQVSIADFLAWEKQHGQLPEHSIVLLKTGFGRYWPDKERYMGTGQRGPDAVAALHFPGLHPDAAKWLVQHRTLKAIGLDTPSIDYGQSTLFGVR